MTHINVVAQYLWDHQTAVLITDLAVSYLKKPQ